MNISISKFTLTIGWILNFFQNYLKLFLNSFYFMRSQIKTNKNCPNIFVFLYTNSTMSVSRMPRPNFNNLNKMLQKVPFNFAFKSFDKKKCDIMIISRCVIVLCRLMTGYKYCQERRFWVYHCMIITEQVGRVEDLDGY